VSTEIPYDPIRISKHVSFRRMQEILEKHRKRIETSKDAGVKTLSSELWLSAKLREHGSMVNPFQGVTDRPQRKEAMRSLIRKANLAEVKCGRRSGADCSFAQVFELIYGEKL
jgi:hypothetical protein